MKYLLNRKKKQKTKNALAGILNIKSTALFYSISVQIKVLVSHSIKYQNQRNQTCPDDFLKSLYHLAFLRNYDEKSSEGSSIFKR